MAAPGKRTARSADEWLLDGSDRNESGDSKPSGAAEDNTDPVSVEGKGSEPIAPGAETSQWMVESATKLNGGPGTAPPVEPPTRERRAEPATPPTEKDRPDLEMRLQEVQAENRDLAARVRELQTQLRMREKGMAELAEKHNDREQRLTKAFETQKGELTKRFEKQEVELRAQIERLESEIAPAEKPAKPAKSPKSDRTSPTLSLNDATFEELRGLGLSITQSARLIAYRDVRGEFDSLDELAEIPGISKKTCKDLQSRLTLSS